MTIATPPPSQRAIRAAIHACQVELLHPRLIRRDGRAFHANPELGYRGRRVDGHLVVCLIALFDPDPADSRVIVPGGMESNGIASQRPANPAGPSAPAQARPISGKFSKNHARPRQFLYTTTAKLTKSKAVPPMEQVCIGMAIGYYLSASPNR